MRSISSYTVSKVPRAFEKVPPETAPRDNPEKRKLRAQKTRTGTNGHDVPGVIYEVLDRDLLEMRHSL